ncbi:hypothetical protein AYO39_01635, partial [Actinobacteria bacterium SCGC AG-212-D09]
MGRPGTNLDPFAATPDPLSGYDRLVQMRTPVWCRPRSCWLLAHHAAVREALRDTTSYSSALGIGERPMRGVARPNLLTTDPPNHQRLRTLAGQAFTAASLRSLETSIRSRAQDLLERAMAKDTFDLVADYAARLPPVVIGDLLGLDETEALGLLPWVEVLATSLDVAEIYDERPGSLRRAFESLDRVFLDLLARSRRQGATPLVRTLITAIDRDRLPTEIALEFCSLLFGAGSETTAKLIANTGRWLLDFDDFQRVGRDPTLIAGAI